MYRLSPAIAAVLLLVNPALSLANATFKIVTASERGTYHVIGHDLAKFVAPAAGIDLEVVPTSGSATNVGLLRHEPGVKLAIVQADVYQAFIDRSKGKNPEARRVIEPLRVVLPLYDTEIHYIVRADSKLESIHDIKGAKINGGLLGSGAAFITHTVYRMMFDTPIPEANASYLSNEQALVKLISDRTVDVVVVAAGQPAPLIANMKPEAQKYIKLLKFDPNHPSSPLALKTYGAYTVRASSYPNLLKQDFTTIAVGAYLVTYNYQTGDTRQYLGRFARSLCENFPRLQSEGHPKWRDVQLGLPELRPGWIYYRPTADAIRACLVNHQSRAAQVKACSAEERILGLCK